MARVLIAEKGLHCSLRIGMYADRQDVQESVAWGSSLLTWRARHAASALSQGHGSNLESTVAAIRDAIVKELEKPTSDVRGAFPAKSPDA
ncbi:MAG: DUF5076 domain-containing protein [Caulobacteraceae bacterium]|nr:DUF5076 domain-containing protein [Caulobacteraceae bacterium]